MQVNSLCKKTPNILLILVDDLGYGDLSCQGTMDLYPTLCEIAGIEIKHEIDGVSLWPVLKGSQEEVEADRLLFWVRREGWFYNGLAYYAARYLNFKLVQNTPFEEFQFFNLKEDPEEKHPIIENTEIIKKLKYQLQEHIKESGKVPFQSAHE